MAGSIPRDFIENLLQRTDIAGVISDRITVKRSGSKQSACCPFHKEKTPSFYIYDDAYHCFGCGAHGNAINFLVEYERLEFVDAVETLAKYAGLDVPYEKHGGASSRPAPKKNTENLYTIMQEVADFYRQKLASPEGKNAATYLQNRDLSGEIAKLYQLGYAPDGWNALTTAFENDSQKQALLRENSVIKKHETKGHLYDFFNNRIMFPIRDHKGRVIAFGGRVMGNDKPKYLNSPETPIFKKSQTLYGLYEARAHVKQQQTKLNRIIVTEGYMDVIALAQYEIHNAVATLGTATSDSHIKLLFRYTPEILFCFDGDNAGRKAAWKAVEACFSSWQDGKSIRFFFVSDGEDPDSLVRKLGTDAFMHALKTESKNLEDFFFDHLSTDLNLNSITDRTKLVHLALPLLQKIPAGIYADALLKQLGHLSQLPEEVINKHLLQVKEKAEQMRKRQQQHSSQHTPAPSLAPPYGNAYDNTDTSNYSETYTELANDYSAADYSDTSYGESGHDGYPFPDGYSHELFDENADEHANSHSDLSVASSTPFRFHPHSHIPYIIRLLLQAPEIAEDIREDIHSLAQHPEAELLLLCHEFLCTNPSSTRFYMQMQNSRYENALTAIMQATKVPLSHDDIKNDIISTIAGIQRILKISQLERDYKQAFLSGDAIKTQAYLQQLAELKSQKS